MASSAPWSAYWEADAAASLAGLPGPARERLDAPWRALAKALPKRAAVLDLACGGGAVGLMLAAERGDVRITGVDAAANVPKRPGMVLRSGIDLAQLPFPDAGFDAVTSRFGIEYGDIDAGAREAARVLRPGGAIRLVIHHSDSVVVRHNAARAAALAWAVRESGWLQRAIAFARARAIARLPIPPDLRAAPEDARRRFPTQSVAWEVLTGIVQRLDHGAARPPQETVAQLTALGGSAEDELARIGALLAAACDEGRRERIERGLRDEGTKLEAATVIVEPASGESLAWLISGARSS